MVLVHYRKERREASWFCWSATCPASVAENVGMFNRQHRHWLRQAASVLEPGTVEQASFLNSLSFLFSTVSFSVHELAASAMLNRTLKLSIFKKLIIWGLTGLGAVISRICTAVYFTVCDPPECCGRCRWFTDLYYTKRLQS